MVLDFVLIKYYLVNNYMYVFGNKDLLIYESNDNFKTIPSILFIKVLSDLIWDVYPLSDNEIIVGFGHNFTIKMNILNDEIIYKTLGEHRCLLYSMCLYKTSDNQIIVLAGTIFNKIILWNSETGETYHILSGHEGVLFKLAISENGNYITSASDDRTVRLWKLKSIIEIPKENPFLGKAISSNDIKNNGYVCVFASFGHTARVWDCRMNNQYIISSSEDCTCRVWDTNGKLLAILGGHNGKHIWSIAIYKNIVVTGGNDSSLKIWDLKQQLAQVDDCTKWNLPSMITNPYLHKVDTECIRGIALTNDGRYSYLTSYWGYIWKLDLKTGEFQELLKPNKDTKFGEFGLLSLSKNEKIMATGDANGNVYIYQCNDCNKSLFWNSSKVRIMRVIFDNDNEFEKDNYILYLCFANGIIDSYKIKWNDEIREFSQISTYKLPDKTFSTTIMAHNDLLFIGDALGEIHIYKLVRTDEDENKPLKTIKNVHKYNVSRIVLKDNILYSIGNNGKINSYSYDLTDNKITFKIVNSIKTGPIVSVSDIYWTLNNEIIVFGFHESELLIYDVTNQYIIFRIESGGWRRPYGIWFNPIHPIQGFSVVFAGIKSPSKLSSYCSSEDILTIHPKKCALNINYHGLEINCIDTINNQSFLSENECLILTGSEDTTMKIIKYNFNIDNINLVQTLEKHTSSIQSICHSSYPDHYPIIFSCGGKRLINIWKFNNSINHTLECISSYPKEGTWAKNQQDQRIISSKSIPIPNNNNLFLHLLITGNSEGEIEIFGFNEKFGYLEPLYFSKYKSRPVLSLDITSIEDIETNEIQYILLTGTTDGCITYWNITNIMNEYIEISKICENLTEQEAYSKKPREILPIYNLGIHKMGVNGLTLISHKTNSKCVILCSVGDDQGLSIGYWGIINNKIIWYGNIEQIECIVTSSLKSIDNYNNYILISGYDQKTLLLEINLDLNKINDNYKINQIFINESKYCKILINYINITSVIECVGLISFKKDLILLTGGYGLSLSKYNL